MRKLTTNRFLAKPLRILCCAGALTACSAWATVASWQLNSSGRSAITDSSHSGYIATVRGFDDAPATDASRPFSYKSADVSGASSTLADVLRENSDSGMQQESRGGFDQGSRQGDSLLFVSNAPTRLSTGLNDAMANSFDENFVSVATVQFASMAMGSTSMLPVTVASGPGPVPVPEMSALFPIVGLIVAVSCTQILRRRRAAQLSAARVIG